MKEDRQGDWTSVKLISHRSNQHLTDKMAYQQRPDNWEHPYSPSNSFATPLDARNVQKREIEEIYPSSLFDRKLDQVMEENSTLYRQEAREDVKDTILFRDRALLFRKYKRILVIMAKLSKSKLHRIIQDEFHSKWNKLIWIL